MDRISFADRVAIVTGAGRGLGRAYALALAGRGAKVVVNDVGGDLSGDNPSPHVAHEVVEEIERMGGTAIADTNSVSDDAGAHAIVDRAIARFGTLDIVINNAGITHAAPFHETSLADFRDIVSVHLFGTAAVTHAAWPILRAKGYGRIVMTASSAGFWGIENLSAYCAAKAGVVGLARSLAHEASAAGIRVNVIAPGAKTRMSSGMFEGKSGWTWRPELVTPAVLHLCSEQCVENGAIFAALAGRFARIDMVHGVGAQLDPRGDIEVEDFAAALPAIMALEGARPLEHGLGAEVRSAGAQTTDDAASAPFQARQAGMPARRTVDRG